MVTAQKPQRQRKTAKVVSVPDSWTAAAAAAVVVSGRRQTPSVVDQHIASCAVDMREDRLDVSMEDDALLLSFTRDCVVQDAGNYYNNYDNNYDINYNNNYRAARFDYFNNPVIDANNLVDRCSCWTRLPILGGTSVEQRL